MYYNVVCFVLGVVEVVLYYMLYHMFSYGV
jgi:hypothetical protein